MFTIINTIKKITPNAKYRNDLGGTLRVFEAIDGARKNSEEYAEKVGKTIAEVMSTDTREQIKTDCERLFRGRKGAILKKFFLGESRPGYTHPGYPILWIDLQRKVHTYLGKNTYGESIGIDSSKLHDIYGVFLVRGRQEGIGELLKEAIDECIVNNIEFHAFCERKKSILDSSGFSLSQIPVANQKATYKKLIVQGLIQNIDGCTYANVNKHFKDAFPLILENYHKVFGEHLDVFDEVRNCKDIDELANKIVQVLGEKTQTGYGRRRENAMRLIQCFFAWGNIGEMSKIQKQAAELVKGDAIIRQFDRIKGVQLSTSGIRHEEEESGGFLYSKEFQYKKKDFMLVWRAKSLESILHKLYETPEYTNIDALRDIIGITLIQKEESGGNVKVFLELMKQIKEIMPLRGFIGKNKGFFTESEEKMLYETGKQPIITTSSRGKTTSGVIKNYSIGGFLGYNSGHQIFGTEIQATDSKSYEAKKSEDPLYKGKGIIALRMRGSKFDTVRGLYNSLDKRLSRKQLMKIKKHLGIGEKEKFEIGDLMAYYIRIGFLVPCKIDGALVFTYSEKMNALIESMDPKKLEIISENSPLCKKILVALGSYDGSLPEEV